MPVLTRIQKYAIIGIGTLGGAAFFYANSYGDREQPQVTNSWTTNFTPSVKWDSNWDRLCIFLINIKIFASNVIN